MGDGIAGVEQGILPRYALSLVIGFGVTVLLFLLMEKLIESERTSYSEPPRGQLLSFVRLLEEPPPVTKRIPPVLIKEPPRVVNVPKIWLGEVCKGFDCGVPVHPPETDPPVVTGGRVATDGEYLPIMKVAPVSPRRAASRGIEGHVLLEFTVTSVGGVRDPVIIDARPPGVFERAATEAALKFKYKPKVLNGRAIEVRGVRNLIRFELENG